MRDNDNPSFSSTLLDKIYSSIENGGTKNEDLKFYTQKKQQRQRYHEKANNADKTKKQGFVNVSEFARKSHHEHELLHDLDYHDGVFFSSTSISSDSSSGCFSSSDTESMYGTSRKTKSSSSSCFVRPWPKPVKTRVSASAQSDNKMLKTGDKKFHGKPRDPSLTKQLPPILPGGRVASFINSLLGSTKKPKSSSSSSPSLSSSSILNREKPVSSSCSSASSFSRSCLSKNSPSTREKLRDNRVKRTVRFSPVSVILDEDSRPCGHKCLYKEERGSNSQSVSASSPWKIGKSPSRKRDEEVQFRIMEKTKQVEEMAREFLKEYHHQNHKKNDLISRVSRKNYEVEDEDDASSCSSSDLFELDHHFLIGLHKYEEELPVYETTHVETNRAIANGFIV